MYGGRDYGSHVQDMIECCERIILFSRDASDQELLSEQTPLRGAVLHDLMILGEASKHVPSVWVSRYASIPWKRIAGMRDKIVHYYFGIDEEITLTTIRTSIPEVLPQLRSMLAEMDAERDGGAP